MNIDEIKFNDALRKASSQIAEAVKQSQAPLIGAAAPSFLLRGMALAAITVLEGLSSAPNQDKT
jgi:hypothetical protein